MSTCAPSDWTAFACHALASIAEPSLASASAARSPSPLHRAASLSSAAYLRFVQGCAPSLATSGAIAGDRLLLGRLWAAASPDAIAGLSALPFACPDLEAFERVARRSIEELAASSEAAVDGGALAGLRAAGRLGEILWCDLALDLDLYRPFHEEHIEPRQAAAIALIEPEIAAFAQVAPGLSGYRVQPVVALGPRGRIRGRTILVGAGAAALDVASASAPHEAAEPASDARHAAALALHECAVQLAHVELLGDPKSRDVTKTWRRSETVAMQSVRRLAHGTGIGATVDAFYARLDRSELTEEVGPVRDAVVARLRELPG